MIFIDFNLYFDMSFVFVGKWLKICDRSNKLGLS